ncbi:hypothetical protein WKH44_16230 [Pantoea agglomerans]|uniref:hypothetical protein n=1 Tax=Enterobacter agglomerans TaxID=549 RepID=UPI003C7CD036
MTETTDLAVLEIKPEQAPALYVPNGLDAYLEQIRQQVNEVPDLSTAKGRARVASLAAQVSRSKTAIEKPGRDYLKHLKEAVKPAEAEIKRFVDACDNLRDLTRKPLTEWEEEQERIAAEKAAEDERLRIEAEQKAAAEALKKQIESDHEMAMLLNDKFDRDVAEAKAEAERQRAAHEEEIRRQAAEQARIEAEQAAQREREAAAKREADLQAAKEKAEADAKAAQERAQLEAREAQERAERQAQEARDKAEREKQAAIEAEQRKAREAEAARLAEEKRVADEAAARAADVAHRKTVNNKALADLVAVGLTEEQARTVITAIAKGEVTSIRITY